jgi:hypothetical protein
MARAWFAPKAVGIGSSWPIRWQGWAAMIVYFVAVGFSISFLRTWRLGLSLVGLTCAFAFVCSLTTEGGWRIRP